MRPSGASGARPRRVRSLAPAAVLLATLVAPPPAGATDGLTLYAGWCARCHGERGDGRGLAAPSLALNGQPPRDFTAGLFRFKSTPDGTAPDDADLARTIARGLPGTSMPYFDDLLDADEIASLVAVVRSFDTTPLPAGAVIEPGEPLPDTPAVRARGLRLYRDLGCGDCHGDGGAGDGPRAAELRNDDGSRAIVRDLTRPWTFRGGSDPADVTIRLATGLTGTPMPSYAASVSREDLWAVARYVASLARAPSLRAAAIEAAKSPPGAGEPRRDRGEYVVKSGTCFLCHVQMLPDGSYDERSFGAGGMKVTIGTVGTIHSRNLTPDPETGLGLWSADDLRRALRDGRSRDGRRLNPLDMPWTIFARLEDRDIDAIHAYLASLAPARNAVPPPEAAPFPGSLPEKLASLLGGRQIFAGFHPGNSGSAEPGEIAAVRNPPEPLVVALTFGLLGAILLRLRRRSRFGRRAVMLLLALGAFAVAIAYPWPPLGWLPPGFVRADPPWGPVARLVSMPPLRPPPEALPLDDPDLRALAVRGRYVATIGSCPLCHTAGPSPTRPFAPFPEMGGGMKVNWSVFGTTYSRNLTPDPETGLGRWTDAEIRRAITSGIARDGRRMHWQAMPWDHFSNLRPEDLEALVFYLRSLPPVWSKVPPARPPAPGDEPADSFWFGYSGELAPPRER